MLVRIKGIKKVRAKGTLYLYHRATGERINADPTNGAAVAAEVERLDKKHAGKHADPGTLGLVIDEYRKSTFWSDLKPKTRFSYERAFAALDALRPMPLTDLSKGFVAKLRDRLAKKRGRWMANYAIAVLSILSEFAMERDWMKANPAANIRRLRRDPDRPQANRPWSPAECRAVLEAAPKYLAVPIGLAMFAGLRKGDALAARRNMIAGDTIRLRTSKRDTPIAVPIHPTLANILAQAPKHSAVTIAANSYGEPWTETGFNSTFCKFIAKLEKGKKVEPGLTFHGLRHTVAKTLREAGADDGTIADILGQKTTAMARHYSKEAELPEKAKGMVRRLKVVGKSDGA